MAAPVVVLSLVCDPARLDLIAPAGLCRLVRDRESPPPNRHFPALRPALKIQAVTASGGGLFRMCVFHISPICLEPPVDRIEPPSPRTNNSDNGTHGQCTRTAYSVRVCSLSPVSTEPMRLGLKGLALHKMPGNSSTARLVLSQMSDAKGPPRSLATAQLCHSFGVVGCRSIKLAEVISVTT